MKRRIILLHAVFTVGLAVAMMALLHQSVMARDDVMVVVVNEDRAEDSLTRKELIRLYNGENRFWQDRSRVQIILPPNSSAEEVERFYEYLGTSRFQLRKEWAGKVFQGKVSHMPVEPRSWAGALEQLLRKENAIAVIPQAAFREFSGKGVRVMKLEGKAPGEDGYPL
jgi:hypothetical protein